MPRALALLMIIATCSGGCEAAPQSSQTQPTTPAEPASNSPATPTRSGTHAEVDATPAPVPVDPHAAHGGHAGHGQHGGEGDELLPAPKLDPAPAGKLRWRDVEPVLAEYCMPCHGPNGRKKARKHVDMAVKPFKGHHKDELATIARVVRRRAKNRLPRMPQGKKRELISDEDIATILQWVADGGAY